MTRKRQDEHYSDEETAQRAREAIRRSFETPYTPQRELVGKTPRARAMAKKRKATGSPKSA